MFVAMGVLIICFKVRLIHDARCGARLSLLSHHHLLNNNNIIILYRVQTGGSVWGEAKHPNLLPKKTAMVNEIIRSCWPAVSESDPEDPEQKLFVANAVISNPPAMGHIHVCEALGIPLHIMFPQPWYYGACSTR